jgi:3-methylcrotonyl-CoA carboxylase alpha subunit
MIAKIIVHEDTRDSAITAMDEACREVAALPVKHNAWFLSRLTRMDDYRRATMTTGTIEARQDELQAEPQPSKSLLAAAAMDAFFEHVPFGDTERAKGLLGFRLNSTPQKEVALSLAGSRIRAPLDLPSGYEFFDGEATWWASKHDAYFEDGAAFVLPTYRAEGTGQASAADGAIIAPMPGKVIAVDVSEGQTVTAGQRLLVLEAMKMEHALAAPFDGVVEGLTVNAGGQVQVEAVLCRVVPAGGEA